MPLAACDPPEVIVKEDSNALIEEPLSFLLIDDVAMNRTMLSRRIKRGIAPNASITEASTGEEALVVCGNEKFDVIVVDQYMEEAGGVMVGTDVVFAMRRMRIDSIIIGCSGNDMDDLFKEAGAGTFLRLFYVKILLMIMILMLSCILFLYISKIGSGENQCHQT